MHVADMGAIGHKFKSCQVPHGYQSLLQLEDVFTPFEYSEKEGFPWGFCSNMWDTLIYTDMFTKDVIHKCGKESTSAYCTYISIGAACTYKIKITKVMYMPFLAF